MPPIVLAKTGVIGGFFACCTIGVHFAFLHLVGLCRAQTSSVSHFRPQYYIF